MKNLRTLILMLIVAGAVLALPAIASADTYCVNAGTACPTGGIDSGSLQAALDAAAATDANDELLLGDKETPYVGPFVYTPVATRARNPLTVKGVGGRPAVNAPVGETVLTANDLSLDGVDVIADFGEGQALDIRDSALSRVNVIGPVAPANDTHGINAAGLVTITDTRVTGGFEHSLSVVGGLGQVVTARRLSIEASGLNGVVVGDGAHLVMSDSKVTAFSNALRSHGRAEVSRSVLATTGPDSTGVAEVGIGAGAVTLDHVTVAHRGAASGADRAFLLATDSPAAETRLQAVAIAGYTRGFRREAPGVFAHPVVVKESVWDPARDELGASAFGVFVESGNAHVTPALVNLAGGDLHPASGSAVIDRDSLTDSSQYADLDGTPALDGDGDGIVRPDAGAFEFRPSPPKPAPPADGETGGGTSGTAGSGGTGSGPGADLTAPVLSRLGLRSGRRAIAQTAGISLARASRLRLLLTASEAAKVKIVPRRVVDGRLLRARGSIVRSVAAGESSIGLGTGLRRTGALRPGQLRLIVSATDAAGNRSTKRVLKLRLVR